MIFPFVALSLFFADFPTKEGIPVLINSRGELEKQRVRDVQANTAACIGAVLSAQRILLGEACADLLDETIPMTHEAWKKRKDINSVFDKYKKSLSEAIENGKNMSTPLDTTELEKCLSAIEQVTKKDAKQEDMQNALASLGITAKLPTMGEAVYKAVVKPFEKIGEKIAEACTVSNLVSALITAAAATCVVRILAWAGLMPCSWAVKLALEFVKETVPYSGMWSGFFGS